MKSPRSSKGFSLVEVLIAVIILGITLVPAMNALQTSLKSSEFHNNSVTQRYHVSGKMEEVLAESFSALDAAAATAGGSTIPSSYSDAGGSDQVFLSRYDVDNADADNDPFTGTEADRLWIRVEFINSNVALETITSP